MTDGISPPGPDPISAARAQAEIAFARGFKPPIPSRVGCYRILDVLGVGGMGIVYLAQQEHPRRLVALKVLKPDRLSPRRRRLLEREAEHLGRLKHTAIAQIYEAGVASDFGEPQPYIVMELVDEGVTIVDYARRENLPPRARLELFGTVCEAVHHAHTSGIVHCDLKPANILIDRNGKPKLLDFGVARIVEHETSPPSAETGASAWSGTLQYMSPEQARGDTSVLTSYSDVYSLGVVMYLLLTDELPYVTSGSRAAALEQIQHEPPRRPGSIRRWLRGDLESILLKALAKSQPARYRSAAALADDIDRYLHQRPVIAGPSSVPHHAWLWMRRHRAATAAILAFAAVLISSAAVATSIMTSTRAERLAERQSYRAWMTNAWSSLLGDEALACLRALDEAPERLRGWEWHHLRTRTDSCLRMLDGGQPLEAVAASADGSIIAGIGANGELGLWSAGDAVPRARLEGLPCQTASVAFDDGADHVTAVGLAPSGRHLWLRAWRIEDRTLVGDRSFTLDDKLSYALSPDGAYMAFVSGGRLRLWDVPADRERRAMEFEGRTYRPVFSADGRRLAAGMYGSRQGREVTLDSDRSYAVILNEGLETVGRLESDMDIGALAFLPDGRTLVTGTGDGWLRMWDVSLGTPRDWQVLAGDSRGFQEIAASPDGSLVASVAAAPTIRLWDSVTGELVSLLVGHTDIITDIHFCEGSNLLVSAARDGTARSWDLSELESPYLLKGHHAFVYPVLFSPDGTYIVSGGWDGFVGRRGALRWWDAATGAPVASHFENHIVFSVALSPDGRRLAVGVQDLTQDIEDRVHLLDARTGRRQLELGPQDGLIYTVAFDPVAGADRLLTTDNSGKMRLWNLASGSLVNTVDLTPGEVDSHYVAAFTADGSRVVSTLGSHGLGIWDARNLELLSTLPGHDEPCWAIAVGPRGRLVATGSNDRTIRIWDIARGDLVATLRSHTDDVLAVAFSPDGSRVASAGRDGSIRLWETSHFDEVAQLHGHKSYVYSLVWSPDGATLASGSGDGTIRLWETQPMRSRLQARRARGQIEAQALARVDRLYDQLDDAAVVVARVAEEVGVDAATRKIEQQLALRRSLERLARDRNESPSD